MSVQVLLGAPNLEDPVRPDLIPAWNKDKENEQIDSTNVKTSESANLAKRPAAAFSLSLSALRKKPKPE